MSFIVPSNIICSTLIFVCGTGTELNQNKIFKKKRKMQPPFFLLFVLTVFVVGVPIEVWARAPQPDTVLRYEPHPTDKKKNLDLSIESTRQKSDIHHKLLDVNGSNLQFEFKDCGNKSSIIKFLDLVVLPNPVMTPGQIKVSFKVEFKQTIVDKLRANVKLNRKIGPGSIEIPCVASVGSCIYDDICNQLKLIKQCPRPFVEYGFNCKCPFKKGLISMPLVQFSIGRNVVPSGKYTLHVQLHHKNVFAGCLKLSLSFSTA